MERKRIIINLKSTSPEGVVKVFKSILEAAAGLGFSEVGVRKAYYAKRDRIGEYQLEWLKVKKDRMAEIIENAKPRINCKHCGKLLTREDRVSGRIPISRYSENGEFLEDYIARTLYEASNLTGVSLNALINAAEKGNQKVTRRKDKATFYIVWCGIHDGCF